MLGQGGGDLPNENEKIEQGGGCLERWYVDQALDGRGQRRQGRHALAQRPQRGQAFVQSLIGRGRGGAGGEQTPHVAHQGINRFGEHRTRINSRP
jgi:hypothetical protein